MIRAHDLLAVATFASPEFRRELIGQMLEECGTEATLRAFADFIGIARSVIENTQEAVAGAVGKDLANRINYPSLLGAMQGLEIAVDPVPGMCRDCAFRKGSLPNQCVGTVMGAQNRDEPFMCHEGLTAEGEPTRVCAGWASSNRSATLAK